MKPATLLGAASVIPIQPFSPQVYGNSLPQRQDAHKSNIHFGVSSSQENSALGDVLAGLQCFRVVLTDLPNEITPRSHKADRFRIQYSFPRTLNLITHDVQQRFRLDVVSNPTKPERTAPLETKSIMLTKEVHLPTSFFTTVLSVNKEPDGTFTFTASPSIQKVHLTPGQEREAHRAFDALYQKLGLGYPFKDSLSSQA